MKRIGWIVAVALLVAIATYCLRPPAQRLHSGTQPNRAITNPAQEGTWTFHRETNRLGDIIIDSDDPLFREGFLPKLRQFFSTLDRFGINPLHGDLQASQCNTIRIISVPNGQICRLIIREGWTATFVDRADYSGMMHFGQRGQDNPERAISDGNTNALARLSQSAVKMAEPEVWRIVNEIARPLGIDPAQFEKPELYEEGLFDYHLGVYTVRYRTKGSDPINQLNYTRTFSLRATSPTTAVLVGFAHLDPPHG